MSVDELRLLVVEDHGFQRWAMSNMLTGIGVGDVLVAADGRAAVEAFHNAETPLDIIITDLDMPGMDGMELVRHLAAARSSASMILVSAHDRSVLGAAEAAARAHGVDVIGTLEKPITTQELRTAIERHSKCGNLQQRDAACGAPLMAADIVRGLRRDEFEAYFQPRVHVPSGEIRGGQAIAVWRHPTYGPLLPARYMATVRACGLQGQVDGRTLESSVTQCRDWRQSGADLSVSVVLSAQCLKDVRLADFVHDLATAHSLDVHHVGLEIDDLPGADNHASAIENIARLRMKGFSIALPYGASYCVPEHFRALPCTELRIDQRYVRKAWTSGSERASLMASIEAARAASMSLSVYGVETTSDWELLDRLAPDSAQGAWFGPPCLAKELVSSAVGETCRVANG